MKNGLDFIRDAGKSLTYWNQWQNSAFKGVSISPKWRDIPCLTAKELVLKIEKDIQHHYRKHSHCCSSGQLNKCYFHVFKVISLGTSDESLLRHKKNYTAEISKSAVWETQSSKGFCLLGILQKLHLNLCMWDLEIKAITSIYLFPFQYLSHYRPNACLFEVQLLGFPA